MNTITLTLGDWSHDGHGLTKRITIESSLDVKALIKAYQAGIKTSGVDAYEIACDYEDGSLPEDDYNNLVSLGFDVKNLQGDDNVYNLTPDGYTAIWLFIAQLGDPKFTFKRLDNHAANINIGGYGLFSR